MSQGEERVQQVGRLWGMACVVCVRKSKSPERPVQSKRGVRVTGGEEDRLYRALWAVRTFFGFYPGGNEKPLEEYEQSSDMICFFKGPL